MTADEVATIRLLAKHFLAIRDPCPVRFLSFKCLLTLLRLDLVRGFALEFWRISSMLAFNSVTFCDEIRNATCSLDLIFNVFYFIHSA
jgi:hypothetical protein